MQDESGPPVKYQTWKEPVNRSLINLEYPYVPHKAVAEVSKIANYRRLVAANHASQSKSTDGSKSGWRQRSVDVVVIVVSL